MSDENLNFNEVDETDSENLTEENVTESGNFNEVEEFETDSSEGNFNETDGSGETLSDIPAYNSIENNAPVSAPVNSYSPTAAPVKNGSSKVLVGVVIALGLVIIGLIVFLIISLANKKSDEKATSAEPTKIVTDIVVDGSEDITGTADTNNGTITDADPYQVPEFNVTCELGQYKGIEVDYEVQEVTDDDVQGALDYFAQTLEEEAAITDRALAAGDYVVIDFVGTIDGEVFDGGSATGATLELGSGTTIPGFEDGMIGKNVGDSVSLDLTFPDSYPQDPDKAGKAVNFLININEAYNYVTPELTDELVAANSDYQTIEEYSKAAREQLELQAKQYSESKVQNDIIQKVIENAKFGGQIDEQIAYEEQDCIDYYDSMCMQSFGVDGATYFGYIWGISREEYLAMVYEESSMSVKYNLILDEIAKKENLTVSQEEYDAMFQETFINTYGFASREEVLTQLSEQQVDETINGYVLHEKAETIIYNSAVINNKPDDFELLK